MTTAIAHRGEPHGNRENTLPAIEAAVAAGADMVEIDLRLTADDRLIVLHDPTLERLWDDRRQVASVSFADLAAVHRAPGGTWSLPTAEEALDLIVRLGTQVMLDVTSVAIGLATQALVRERGLDAHVLYAGDTEALAQIRERQPGAAIALSWGHSTPPGDDVWERVRPQYFNPEWIHLNEETVAANHAAGRLVSTWTVDEPKQMARLSDLGVDAIISNRIAALVEVVRRPTPNQSAAGESAAGQLTAGQPADPKTEARR
ncbi:glycerophosphodiester phosphodiesterase [Actinopolymorpha singaporensis]|uniref:Glycerophosphoryl diester phosphodiesterase n=1 Tax=Actinopolymorpha singaporensis TaxID=117157 RepID=A0A1H1WXD3_9ACTN|nr:glycerophosphodiester phosphodiesterase [Actinopolymorpha singaporensis]SDT01803.1 glycerophosphoryl diester phosphodiesterase [Actinopolymorpha singaporensis]